MQHTTCPHCGAPLEEAQLVCPSCGRDLPPAGAPAEAHDRLRRQAAPWVVGVAILLLLLMVCVLAFGFNWLSGSAGSLGASSPTAPGAAGEPALDGAPAPVTRLPTRTPGPAVAVRPTATPPPPTATVATRRLVPTLADGTLWADSFDDPESGWDVVQDAHGEIAYRDGQYLISVHTSYTLRWGNAHSPHLADFVLSADAQHLEGPADSSHGLVVRYVDPNNFYSFDVSGLGAYRFGKFERNQWTDLIPWTPSDAIQPGQANRLAVRCQGDAFVLYANGVELGSAQDASFSQGDIALSAQSDNSVVRIAFDNVTVRGLD